MKGKFIISLDFELLWGLSGWNLKQIDAYKAHIEGARLALRQILDIFAHYDMKCTVAFVGGMNYDSLDEFSNVAPELHPHYSDSIFSSYDSLIPYLGTHFRLPLFFCKNVITELMDNQNVELASHTFSHYYCLEEGQNSTEFEADISTALSEAKKSGITLKTVIFPRNQVTDSYLRICSRYGLTHYRGNLENYLYRSEHTPKKYSLRRVLRLLDTYINLSGYNTYTYPQKVNGMINVPGSRFLRPYSASLSILEPLKISRIKNSMKHAALHSQIYHLWWHPHNFGINTNQNLEQLESICSYFHELNKKYDFQTIFISEIK